MVKRFEILLCMLVYRIKNLIYNSAAKRYKGVSHVPSIYRVHFVNLKCKHFNNFPVKGKHLKVFLPMILDAQSVQGISTSHFQCLINIVSSTDQESSQQL